MHEEPRIDRLLEVRARGLPSCPVELPAPRCGVRARRRMLVVLLPVLVAMIARGPGRDRPAIAAGAPAQAIERGLAYLRRNPTDLSALIVLDYLQRKYALPAEVAFEATRAVAPEDRRFAVWGRFVGEDRLTDASLLGSLTAGAGIEEMVMHALYCDRFPLPAAYGGLLQRLAERGDYELTHAALAVKLLRDRGCPLEGIEVPRFEQELRRRIDELLRRAPRDRRFEELDVRYEALAILQDFLAGREVSPSEIARILAEQQPDGGWRPQADQPSAPHPTVMAVWALLAWSHAGPAEIRFARR